MPLNGNDLGDLVYAVRQTYSNQTLQQLVTAHGSLENARKAAARDEMTVIVNYIKTNAGLTVPGTGMAAGATAVSGVSTTGTIS